METVEFDRLDVGDARVLDVGCGEGRHAVAAAYAGVGEVVALDVNPDRLRTARDDYDGFGCGVHASGTFVRGDALSLPFDDGVFDVVVCSEVLEHLPDYVSAIDELRRVCRADGRLVVSVPRYGPERVCWFLSDGYHEVDGGHVRVFERSELRNAVEERGFRQVDSHFAHALHSPYWWLRCLWWRDDEGGGGGGDGSQPLPVRAYERFLEWYIVEDPGPLRAVEEALDPLMGKSVVLYFEGADG